MNLERWLTETGTTPHQLHLKAGVSMPVIGRAKERRANLSSAIKLHLATGRKVPISSMTAEDVPPSLEQPTKKQRRKAVSR